MNTADLSQNRDSQADAVRSVNVLSNLRVIPTGAAVGAEIRGVHLSLPVPEEVREALRKAWADNLVLVFRGQHIDDDQLVEVANIFGGSQEAGARKFYFTGGAWRQGPSRNKKSACRCHYQSRR